MRWYGGPSNSVWDMFARCVPWCGVRGVLPNDQERLCFVHHRTSTHGYSFYSLLVAPSSPGKLRLLSSV